jgi:GNAT superfamily N-acetyltransferase
VDGVVRAATDDDRARMQAIEVAAGERFRTVGLGHVADHDPYSLEDLHGYVAAGRAWIAESADGVIGYAAADLLDGAAHLEQVSVDPAHQGRGVGRSLVEHVVAWARDRGDATVTLTTYRDVEWNAPLYRHLGFRVLRDDELTPGLVTRRAEEARHGLDPGARVCMRLDLGG